MKKWMLPTLLLLLTFAGCLYNIRCVDRLTAELLTLTEDALTFSEAGDYASAAERAEKAAALWAEKDGYTHIFIRHSEIDSATDAFCDYLGAIYAREPGEIRGCCQKLGAHLRSIAGMEHITFGSVL